jgi:hypothetical protein
LGWGDALAERRSDRRQHALRVSENLVVPEAENPKALGFQPSRPPSVSCDISRVLTAIDFDDEAAFHTDEIGNIRTERHLPPESLPKLASPQPAPQPRLSVSEVASELSGMRVRHA